MDALQSPRLRGRSRLGTASACHFLQGEYGGAGDIADDGKRQAIEAIVELRARFRKRLRPTWNAHAEHDRMV